MIIKFGTFVLEIDLAAIFILCIFAVLALAIVFGIDK